MAMRIFVRVLSAIASAVLAFGLLGYTTVISGRTGVLYIGLAALVALAVVRRRRVLLVPWVWSAAVALGVGLVSSPYDVLIDGDFPPGVYVRPAVWGLLSQRVPEDEAGVPEFWWSGTCLVPRNAPEKAIIFGY